MHLAHVFIGRFDLPVPLSTVLVAAMAVVAASFGLIYLLPPRPAAPDKTGPRVPRALVIVLQTVAVLTVLYLAALPPILAFTVCKGLYKHCGFIRYNLVMSHLLVMVGMVIKMVLRWTISLKYVIFIPEYFFNV